MTQKMIVGYCRAASANQPQIDRQKKLLKEYAKKQNLHIKEFYTDNGQSGATLERPEFEKLLRDCKGGKVSMVLVADVDRLARNNTLVAEALRLFGKYKVRVRMSNESELKYFRTMFRAIGGM